jgi:NADH-quinone oxidoreductase subunit G
MEGRPQITERASFPPGDAREDWAIIRALSDAVGQTLPFDTLAALRAKMYAAAPHLARIGVVEAADASGLAAASGAAGSAPFADAVPDYYLTNPIARASAVMAECSALARGAQSQAAE